MLIRTNLPRRRFLQGTGALMALPALEMFCEAAPAGAAGPPLRLLCVFQPNGVYPKAWDVEGTGSGFRLSQILEPLAALRDDIVVVSKLDNVGVRGHVQMTSSFLTGVGVRDGRNAVSLDMMVAERIGKDTKLPAIQLGTEPPRGGGDGSQPIAMANTVTWSSPTTRVSPEINPRVAFDRMFRDQSSPEARRFALQRKSVVDLVMEDARRLRKYAGAQDRAKLDEYLESVRSVEADIERTLNPPPRSWVPLQEPELRPPAPGLPRRRDQHLKLMIDLCVLALQTDTTRVATLMTAHGFSRQNFTFLPGVTSDHHGMSHHKNQPGPIREYTTVSRWYIEQLAYMLKKMKGIDEGNGSLLDNTLVLYGSGMKDGNGHVRTDLPIILAGRAQGRLKTGRHVVAKQNTPLANLLLTIANKFGLELPSFNGRSTGELSELG
ncbi:MAG: DUF1552 domain-containing protein [Planctomycetota bacterium]|nr:MAG: DUF1552 domain-containing protein [Planctomycetota bacterium]